MKHLKNKHTSSKNMIWQKANFFCCKITWETGKTAGNSDVGLLGGKGGGMLLGGGKLIFDKALWKEVGRGGGG